MSEYESPYENPEFNRRRNELNEKEKQAIKECKIAEQVYKKKSQGLDDVFEEIRLLKEEYGIYQNVR